MDVRSYIYKLLLLPKSATFLIVAPFFLQVSYVDASSKPTENLLNLSVMGKSIVLNDTTRSKKLKNADPMESLMLALARNFKSISVNKPVSGVKFGPGDPSERNTPVSRPNSNESVRSVITDMPTCWSRPSSNEGFFGRSLMTSNCLIQFGQGCSEPNSRAVSILDVSRPTTDESCRSHATVRPTFTFIPGPGDDDDDGKGDDSK